MSFYVSEEDAKSNTECPLCKRIIQADTFADHAHIPTLQGTFIVHSFCLDYCLMHDKREKGLKIERVKI